MNEERREGKAAPRPASADEIVGILGPVDEVLLVDIRRTGRAGRKLSLPRLRRMTPSAGRRDAVRRGREGDRGDGDPGGGRVRTREAPISAEHRRGQVKCRRHFPGMAGRPRLRFQKFNTSPRGMRW